MSQANDSFKFTEETTQQVETKLMPIQVWKVLSVEDNVDYQNALVASLQALILPKRTRLKVLTANSAFEASQVLNAQKDIGLILLDVVMEEDDAGLRLVSTIREEQGNAQVRIVLLTGQPGFAPEKEVMSALDIDEYWNKADITPEKLHSIVSSNIRTWNYIAALNEAKQGLQIVLDAARSINSRYDLPSFTRAVLNEIGHIIGVKKGGIVCAGDCSLPFEQAQILSATGFFAHLEGLSLADQQLSIMHADIRAALERKQNVITPTQSFFYFETKNINEKCYLVVVNSEQPLTSAHINLLKVFCENISSGFTNIALLNRVTELAYTHSELNIPNRNWLSKEIHNMSRQEWRQTRLLMLEVKFFDEMKFTFGYEFIQGVLANIYQNLGQILPSGSRVTLSGHKQFSILLDKEFKLSPELIDKLTINEIKVDGVAHTSLFSLLDMQLDTINQNSATKIVSMAESALKEATLKNISYVQYSQEKTDTISQRYSLMTELRQNIREGKLNVMLQPKINLSTGEVVGFESLARWQRDDGSFVPPDEFIAIAETSGLIISLDCLIFEKTMQALQRLIELGYTLPVAFNASSFDLLHPDYFTYVSGCIEKYGLSSDLLELEVTETQAITDYERIRHSLQRFAALGIKISLDDFGTGYSSLAHISNITAHCIKIDRSFVSQLETDENSQHVINMILNLGKKFNFTIVAEGIETDYQKQWLTKMGCDVGQGYLFAKPMVTDELIEWLSTFNKN